MSKVKPGRALINNTKTKYDKKENINPVYRDYIEKIPKEGYIKSVGKLKSTFPQSFRVIFKREFIFLLQLNISFMSLLVVYRAILLVKPIESKIFRNFTQLEVNKIILSKARL